MPTPAPASSTRSPSSRVGGECAVGSFDRHSRPGPQPRERGAVVAEVLDGDPQAIVPRRRGERVRVGLPPQPATQEAPLQELTARDRELVQPPPLEHDGERVRTLGPDRLDRHAMAQRAPDRQPDARTRGRAPASRPTARSTTPSPTDARRTTRPCRPGARTTETAPGRCRGARTTTSRTPAAAGRSGRTSRPPRSAATKPTVAARIPGYVHRSWPNWCNTPSCAACA